MSAEDFGVNYRLPAVTINEGLKFYSPACPTCATFGIVVCNGHTPEQVAYIEGRRGPDYYKALDEGRVPPEIGVKYSSGKLRHSLIPKDALLEVIRVLEYGAKKYSPENWRKVPNLKQEYYDAGERHRTDEYWIKGTQRDDESKLHVLAHSICCDLFLLQIELEKEGK
jgi:hypothetical protein